MLENIFLAIVLPLGKAGEYFVSYILVIDECWRIFSWIWCCHLGMLKIILLAVVLELLNSG